MTCDWCGAPLDPAAHVHALARPLDLHFCPDVGTTSCARDFRAALVALVAATRG